ncbi:DUF3592 domain-containing protein [Streptomyces niveus]|uniref:hypothetical protein n=1 Tax=Streptomyces niveus TaxID=193462 RepID=UPI003667E99B
MTATFLGDTVVIERAEERITIPLRVIRAIRAAEGRSRTVEITLADAVVHTIAANNPTAAATFVAAVAAVLPTPPDERGSALVRTEARPASSPLFSSRRTRFLFVVTVVTYVAYAGYLTVVHGPSTLFGAVFGLFPLSLGVVGAIQTARHLYDKAVLRRRGVIVQARTTGGFGKRSVYAFKDADGTSRKYRSRMNADVIEVAYDPVNPKRMASVTPLLLEIPRMILMTLFTALFVAVGVGAVFGPVLP